MDGTNRKKFFNKLYDNIETLQEIVKQQEKQLIELLTKLDKVNGVDFAEDELDNKNDNY